MEPVRTVEKGVFKAVERRNDLLSAITKISANHQILLTRAQWRRRSLVLAGSTCCTLNHCANNTSALCEIMWHERDELWLGTCPAWPGLRYATACASPCPFYSTAAVPMAPNCIILMRKNYVCKNFRGKGGTGICSNGVHQRVPTELTLLWNHWAVLTTWKDIAKLEAHFWNHSNKSQISCTCMHYREYNKRT